MAINPCVDTPQTLNTNRKLLTMRLPGSTTEKLLTTITETAWLVET